MDSLDHVPPPPTLSALSRPELEALLPKLFSEVTALKQAVAELREENARLKGLKGRPNIKPSGMEKGTPPAKPAKDGQQRGRGKVAPRVPVKEEIIHAEIPPGSICKGHEPFLVQDLVISAKATCYLRERWITPDGRTILAPLPAGTLGHFGPELRRFVLVQYHQGQSTMPRLLALLRSIGIAISKRQLVRLLNENHAAFLAEAQDVLRAGLQTSPWVSVDDTGACHATKNGFCTQVGNEWFTPAFAGAGYGSAPAPRKAGLIFSICYGLATPITCSMTRLSPTCACMACRLPQSPCWRRDHRRTSLITPHG